MSSDEQVASCLIGHIRSPFLDPVGMPIQTQGVFAITAITARCPS